MPNITALMPHEQHTAQPAAARQFITLYHFGVRLGVLGFGFFLAMPFLMAILAAHGMTASHAIPGPVDQSVRGVMIAPVTGGMGLFMLAAGILCMVLGTRGKREG